MICARLRLALVLPGLLASSVSFASIRMTGLGPNMVGVVDDPVTDMLRYPQLNALEDEWLTGLEMRQPGDYFPFARTPGRLSVAAALDAELEEEGADGDPSLAVSWRTDKLAIGASVTAWAINQRPRDDWEDLRGDTSASWSGYGYGLGEGTIGCSWSKPGFALDGNIDVDLARGFWWRGTLDSFVQCGDNRSTVISPVLRLTFARDRITWRVLASYSHTFFHEDFYDTLGERSYKRRENWHTLGLTGGATLRPAPSFLVATELRSRVSPAAQECTWDFLLPAGCEWHHGPLTLRMGAEAGVTLSSAAWRHGKIGVRFYNQTYFGLGLTPIPRVSLDFTPYMEDIASLRGWKVGATVRL
jgi:hypothetical protein